MIKIKDYEAILKSVYAQDVLNAAVNVFRQGLGSSSASTTFVKDFLDMGVPQPILKNYYNEGLSVLMPVVNSKKKLDITMVSDAYILYTGLLNREFVIGYDTTKGMVTSIYTKSEILLDKLFKAGAFDNTEKYQKNMKALFGEGKQEFGNKVVSSFEKSSLAMGRLDISAVVGDEVSLDLIVPNKFRIDYGDTFKLYPYSVFPFLADSLIVYVNSSKETSFQQKNKKVIDVRGITVLQAEEDGNVKTRKMAFKNEEVVKAYRRGTYATMEESDEAKIMLENQLKKTRCKWDCLKLYLKGFNLEASLYSVPYSTIRFERLLNITPCSLKDIDTSQYMVDFDSVRRLFRARVNNWKLNDFHEFNKILDTESCANIPDRCQMIDAWATNLDDSDLYKIMKMKRNLFEPEIKGEVKTIEAGLHDMYRQKPKASKSLMLIDLEPDFTVRKKQLQGLLLKGVCRIESVSTRTGAPRMYMATNNDSVLNAAYGPKKLLQFESTKRSIERISDQIKSGKIANLDRFVHALHDAEIDGIVDYSGFDTSSTPGDWLQALGMAFMELENNSKDRTISSNPFIVNFRRINADSSSEFYGAVDVRNIASVEFGEQRSRLAN